MMRRKLLLNDNWKFFDGEIPIKPVNGHHETYMHSKAQNGLGPADPNFYDANFQVVNVPHDYVLDGEVSKEHNESQGGFIRNTAWYRKQFELDCDIDSSRVIVMFDGAGMTTDVWCNGHFAGHNDSMYNGFYVDVTPYLSDHKVNTLSVRIENRDIEGWWYEGAGLYRDVWVVVTNNVAVDVWGTYVNPTKIDGESWTLPVETTVFSSILDTISCEVRQTVLDKGGKKIAESLVSTDVVYGNNVVKQIMDVNHPNLWDLENPYLYTVVTEVIMDGEAVDEYTTPFGFRTFEYNAQKGFFLNDKHVKMRGVCMHQDHGNAGVAMSKAMYQYRFDQLKSVGVNAYRAAHNNPAPVVLDMCDQQGMLMLDENRWFNYSDMRVKELVSMLKRDRNRPSVVMWAVANEEPVQGNLTGKRLVEMLKGIVRQYDTTRPVSIALNGGFYDSFGAGASDVVAVNYNIKNYDKFPEAHPNKAIVATESGASNNNRGIYKIDDPSQFKSQYATAYDEQRAVFGSAYIDAIKASEVNDFICGTFVWAGMEYRGEAVWPKLFSGSGLFDSCAFKKDTAYMAAACWTKEPMVHIMPHWNLETVGEDVKVVVYTNCTSLEMFINGTSLGKQDVVPFEPTSWNTTYQPGDIKAVGFIDGKEAASEQLFTAGKANKINITPHTTNVDSTGEDCGIFTVHLTDDKGNTLHQANFETDVSLLNDQCEILSVSSGDPMDHTHSRGTSKKLFGGLLQIIVKAKEGGKEISFKVDCKEAGLSETFTMPVVQVPPIDRVKHSNRNLSIDTFRTWFGCTGYGDMEKEYNFDDMNTSEPIAFATYTPQDSQPFMLYTTKYTMPICSLPMGLTIAGLTGPCKVKVFHDRQPNMHYTPKEFLTVEQEFDNIGESTIVPLPNFLAYEKIKIMIMHENTGVKILDVYFTVL